jgi:hypothetical protein
VTHRERGRDRGAADREEQRQEQDHVEVGGGVLDDPDERRGAPAAFLLEPERPDAVHPRDRDLRCGEEPRQDDRDGDEDQRQPVGRGHGERTPL